MAIKFEVLKQLQESKGEWISGQELANLTGVTRNSVWKAINTLRKDGHKIEAVTNKGYTLVANNNTISVESIQALLRNYNAPIFVHKEVTSTNDLAKDLASKGAQEGTLIVADMQTKGRGRMGRRFESPAKTGTYISLILRPKFSASDALYITTTAAVAVAMAIEEISNRETKIKWVNDIYIENKKVSGILTDASTNFETGMLEYAVLGIGINVTLPEGGFPDEIKDIAGSVYEKDCPDNARSSIIASLVQKFFEYYNKLPDRQFLDIYKKKSLLTGKTVSFEYQGEMSKGKVLGIDDEARLEIELENKKKILFSAGEVNLQKDFLGRDK